MGYSDFAADGDCLEPPLLEGTYLLNEWQVGFYRAENFESMRECHRCVDPDVLPCSIHD